MLQSGYDAELDCCIRFYTYQASLRLPILFLLYKILYLLRFTQASDIILSQIYLMASLARYSMIQQIYTLLNNLTCILYELFQSSRQLSVSFRNMQLRKIKRAEKKGTESVMDEKFSLLFQSQFSVGGGELVFQVMIIMINIHF